MLTPSQAATRERTGVKKERRLTANRGGSRNCKQHEKLFVITATLWSEVFSARGQEGPKEG
jgi:hypothetical protein